MGGEHTDEHIVRNRLAGVINSDVTALKYDVALSAQIMSSISYLTSLHNSEVESCILGIIEMGPWAPSSCAQQQRMLSLLAHQRTCLCTLEGDTKMGRVLF